MSNSPSVEEIMQRIRAQMAQRSQVPGAGAGRDETPAELLQRMQSKAATEGPAATTGVVSGGLSQGDLQEVKFKFHSLSQLRLEIDTSLEGTRETGQLNPRNPGVVNEVLQTFKKAMRRSLTWYTRPLHKFEGGVVRALEQIRAILENHTDLLRNTAEELNQHAAAIRRNRSLLSGEFEEKIHASLEQHAQEFRGSLEQHAEKLEQDVERREHAATLRMNEFSIKVDTVRAEIEGLRAELNGVRSEAAERNRLRERDFRRLMHLADASNGGGERNAPIASAPMFPPIGRSESGFDYFTFKDKCHAEEDDLRERREVYLEYFRGRDNVADVGCGHGEFLELLRENKITARGTEAALDQFLLCREKGLDVTQQDALSFLESLPDESLGGLFSAHVVERLTAGEQLRAVTLAYKKTQSGSPVIFETINPQCAYALLRNFFLDPTYIRPMHPETLKFAMESVRFRNVELRLSSPVSEKKIPVLQLEAGGASLDRFNRAMEDLSNLLYGYRNYAAIGWK